MLTKIVVDADNPQGKVVPLDAEEEAALIAEWEANAMKESAAIAAKAVAATSTNAQ